MTREALKKKISCLWHDKLYNQRVVSERFQEMLYEAHEQIELLKVELAVLKAGKDK